MLAGKAPGARRLKVVDKDVCLQDVYAALLRCHDVGEEGDYLYDLQADVLLRASMTMSEEVDAIVDLVGHEDPDEEGFAPMIPSKMMK